MTKLSYGPLWKENNKWENVGLCYILSMTSLPIYGFQSMVFGHDGFWSIVLGAMVFGPWFLDTMVFGPLFWTRWFSVHGTGCFGMYKYVL